MKSDPWTGPRPRSWRTAGAQGSSSLRRAVCVTLKRGLADGPSFDRQRHGQSPSLTEGQTSRRAYRSLRPSFFRSETGAQSIDTELDKTPVAIAGQMSTRPNLGRDGMVMRWRRRGRRTGSVDGRGIVIRDCR